MKRRTIDYGIDFGTTNSVISRMENGKPVVFRDEISSNVVPSCVYYTRSGRMLAGRPALQRFRKDLALGYTERAAGEFKTSMGTDARYSFPGVKQKFSPEELSSDILTMLKGMVSDEDVKAAVITVPAAFGQSQIEATQRAAEKAGLLQVELLPEPAAASIAYGFDKHDENGYWLVFDMGGGTFDAVLMKMDGGLISTVEIAGDPMLGGKNMDYALVDEIIMPELEKECGLCFGEKDAFYTRVRRLCKNLYAEEAKISLSSSESTVIDVDLNLFKETEAEKSIIIDRKTLDRLAKPFIGRAVRISLDLCRRNKIKPSDLTSVIMVGGPSYMPCLREALKKSLGTEIKYTFDPMTLVARGAAVYASTISLKKDVLDSDRTKVSLKLGLPAMTLEKNAAVCVNGDAARGTDLPDKCTAEIIRLDKGWKSAKMNFEKSGAVIKVPLVENCSNEFGIKLFTPEGDRLETEPSGFSILQGMKTTAPLLPMDICVEIKEKDGGAVLKPIVSKGEPLPATGILRKLCTRNSTSPENPGSFISIPVYEGEAYTEAVYNNHIGEMKIEGRDIRGFLPRGSEIEITMKVDRSRRKIISAYIELTDQTFENIMEPLQKIKIDMGEVERSIKMGDKKIQELEKKYHFIKIPELETLKNDLDSAAVNFQLAEIDRENAERAAWMARDIHKRIDCFVKEHPVESGISKMHEALKKLRKMAADSGDSEDKAGLERILKKVARVKDSNDIRKIRQTLTMIRGLMWDISRKDTEYWINEFEIYKEGFKHIKWTDERLAEDLIEEGNCLINNGKYEDIMEIALRLRGLQRDNVSGDTFVRKGILESLY